MARVTHARRIRLGGRRLLTVGAVAAGAAAVAFLAARPPWTDRTASLARPELQRVLDRLVAGPNVTPGAVGVVITREGTWRGAAGVADLATRAPATPDHRARVASLTKTYTATLVLQLVGRHELGLDDTVARRLPGALPADKARITIRQLLSHTSGLYDSMNDAVRALGADSEAFYASLHDPALAARVRGVVRAVERNPETRVSPKLWVEIAAREPLYFSPGTGYHYSNTNYVLLGWIVERATQEKLGDLMAEWIFRPLGLTHSVYDPGPGLPAPYLHGYALPADPGGTPVDQTRVTLGIAGASSVVATAEDVALFYKALFDGRLVPKDLMEETMLPEQMGIGRYEVACGAAHGHNGAWDGYLSFAKVGDDGTTAVLLMNGSGPESSLRGEAASGELLCGAE